MNFESKGRGAQGSAARPEDVSCAQYNEPVGVVLGALRDAGCDPKRSGAGWLAKCPAHDDRTPSLSIDIGNDGRALLHCFAGCSHAAILAALALSERDLFADNGDGRRAQPKRTGRDRPAPKRESAPRTWATMDDAIAAYTPARGEPSSVWRYTDSAGELVGVVARWDSANGKSILPYARLDDGRWAQRAMPTPRPLYALGALLAAAPGATVFVVEGEKCADALQSVGVVATTSVGGAKAAGKTDWAPLAGRDVAILPDADGPGESYARDAARLALEADAASVRIVRMGDVWPDIPTGGDVADALGADGPWASLDDEDVREKLAAMLDRGELVDREQSGAVVVELAKVKREQVRWLWPGRIALGKLTLLAGDPGLGKSLTTIDLAARVTMGRDFPDGEPNTLGPRGVVLVSAEDGAGDTIAPRFDAARGDPSRVRLLDGVRVFNADGSPVVQLWTIADVASIEQAIDAAPGCALVVVDPISAYMPEGVDSHRNTDVRAALRLLSDVAERKGVAVVAVTHLRKGEGSAIYRAMGSLAFVAAARAVFGVVRDSEDETGATRLWTPVKNNLAPLGMSIPFETTLADGGDAPVVVWGEPVERDAEETMGTPRRSAPQERDAPKRNEAANWLRALLADGPRRAADIKADARAAGLEWRTVERAKEVLGVVAYHDTGFGADGAWWWRLRSDGPPSKAATDSPEGDEVAPYAIPPEKPIDRHEESPGGGGGGGGSVRPRRKGDDARADPADPMAMARSVAEAARAEGASDDEARRHGVDAWMLARREGGGV